MARMAQDRDLASGILRGVTGPLVKIPAAALPSTAGAVGAGASAALNFGQQAANPDGSGSQFTLTAPNGVGYSARVITVIYGRVVGVRFRRNVNAPPAFDVVIDGVAYPVDNVQPKRDNQAVTWTDFENLVIVADNLDDTEHTVEVILAGDPAGSATQNLTLLGWVGERGRGYNDAPPPRRPGVTPASTPAQLPSTAQAITTNNTLYDGIRFRNTDTVSRTVTVYGPDNGASIYATLTLAAGEDKPLTLPSPRQLTTWKWKADAANVVAAWMELS